VVFGMLTRRTKEVRAMVVPNAKKPALFEAISANIGKRSTIWNGCKNQSRADTNGRIVVQSRDISMEIPVEINWPLTI